MNIAQKVRGIVKAQMGLDEVKDDATTHDMGFDSLDEVELVMALECEFSISIPDAAAERLKTVNDCVRYISANSK